MSYHPQTAMLLAAGRGTRMRPLTDQLPKPLLPVAGKPLIVWQIERLKAAGIAQIVINHAYRGQQIVQTLGDGRTWGVKIHYSPEPPEAPLETGGGIQQALPLLGNQPFLVVNSDLWCDLDYDTLTLNENDLACLVLVPNPTHHPTGDFHLTKNQRVTLQATPRHTFSGIGVYHPTLFQSASPGTLPLATLLRPAIQANQVAGRYYSGQWADIGTPQRLDALNQQLQGISKNVASAAKCYAKGRKSAVYTPVHEYFEAFCNAVFASTAVFRGTLHSIASAATAP